MPRSSPGAHLENAAAAAVEDLADTRLAAKKSRSFPAWAGQHQRGQRPAVRVRADPRKLAAYGLNIDDLRTTLGNANVNTPKGNFDGPTRASTINANDQLQTASAYKDLVIAYRNGSPVRLSDVAEAIGRRRERQARRLDEPRAGGRPQRQRQARPNVIGVVMASRRCCRNCRVRCPQPSMSQY